jgi:hypothetical protein
MMRKLLVTALLTSLLSCKQSNPTQEKITDKEVRDFIAMYDKAWGSKDTITVDKLMGKNYVYFSSTGGTSTRHESLTFLADPNYRLTATTRTEIKIHVSGNTAVVSTHWTGKGYWKKDEINDNQRCGLIIQKNEKGIQIITEHCTEIK